MAIKMYDLTRLHSYYVVDAMREQSKRELEPWWKSISSFMAQVLGLDYPTVKKEY